MTRISTAQLFSSTLNIMRQKQTSLAELQQALASGKRIARIADDPVGAGRILEVRALTERIERYGKNLDAADSRLVLEETSLSSVSDGLNRARELSLATVNGINNEETLAIYGNEVLTILDQILGLANTKDANGEYIFAGTLSQTEPFGVAGTGAFTYFGNSDRRQINISDNLRVAMTDPGAPIFQDLAIGNGDFQVFDNAANTGTGIVGANAVSNPTLWVPDTYTITFLDPQNYEVRDSGAALVTTGTYQDPTTVSFLGATVELTGQPATGDTFTVSPGGSQDIFTTLQELGVALNASTTLSASARTNLVFRAIANIDQALSVNQDTRTDIGTRLQLVDRYRDLNQRQVIQAQDIRSRIEDLDYAQAISDFEFQSTTLEAAQKTFLALRDLNLFRLL